jgi:hypothetical protein
MTEKIYDITFDSDGWSCRSGGNLLGSFPSWLLAIGATRAAAEKDKKNGIKAVIRFQDMKGATHTLDADAESLDQSQIHHDPNALRQIDRLAPGHRPH